MSKTPWIEIGKLFDPPKDDVPARADEPKQKEKQKAKKAIRRKHGKNSKI